MRNKLSLSKGKMSSQTHMVLLPDAIRTCGYVGLWITLSAGVILHNKWILTESGFPFPVALTMIHMAFCSSLVGGDAHA